jgi:hypothetical protein
MNSRLGWTDFSAIIENYLALGCTKYDLARQLMLTKERDDWTDWVEEIGIRPALSLIVRSATALSDYSEDQLRTDLYERFVQGWGPPYWSEEWPPVIEPTRGV